MMTGPRLLQVMYMLVAVAGGHAAAHAAATCAGAASGGEWRSYGHDYGNSRHQELETVITPLAAATLSPVWSFSASDGKGTGDFTGTPVIADGCVYVGSTMGWVFALNADTGALVWATKLATTTSVLQGGVYGSVGVDSGKVFVGAGANTPFVAALDQATGTQLWSTQVDDQSGSEIYSSATIFDGMVIFGVSGGAAELSSSDVRDAFHGSIVLLDETTGSIIQKIYTVPLDAKDPSGNTYAGGGVWAPNPAIDTVTKYGYFAVGNPFNQQFQYKYTDSIIKVDLDQTRSSFAQIVGAYAGTIDQYYPGASSLPCVTLLPSGVPPYYPTGLGACGDLDMDFGASPNILATDASGSATMVGDGQKSGVYHAFDTTVQPDGTMRVAWTALVGLPSQIGGIVGSETYDGKSVTGPITQLGYLWSVNATTGLYDWFTPVLDVAHYGPPVSSANGVIYTVDLRGFLDAYDAATGVPLLMRPMTLGSITGSDPPVKSDPILSWGGVAIARNTVYASVGIGALSNGYVIAYKPANLPLPNVPLP